VSDLLRAITNDKDLRRFHLDNPDAVIQSLYPEVIRGPVWNISKKLGKAPFVCSVMRDYLVDEFMSPRRNFLKTRDEFSETAQQALEHMKKMNGIEFDKYGYPWWHVWAGIFPSGTDRFGDYRVLDPWWGQHWLDEWRDYKNLNTKYYEEQQHAKLAATVAVFAAAIALVAGVPVAASLQAAALYIARDAVWRILVILGVSAATGEEAAAGSMALEDYVMPGGTIRDYSADWLRIIVKEIAKS